MNIELEISNLVRELQKLGFASIEDAQNWVSTIDPATFVNKLQEIESLLALLKMENLPSLTELEMELKVLEKEKKELGIEDIEIENISIPELIAEIKTLQKELEDLKI